MEGERVVFTEETTPQNYLKLIASGDFDATMLEALEDFVKRQKKRLAQPAQPGRQSAHSDDRYTEDHEEADRRRQLDN